ncbi:MAG: cytochrome c-type biogenesis protein CcmH [Candidatus Dadabacteria bacterium]|nr:cytochrome c-type biogenesis protein CcmH [Candidatus Dadabacteria bacterium]MYA48256.1 cytochrome c-type biogenesis protein CcmH [Candidatus Dadabacteria bacterium]MYF47743.1 cytochrome c-type biogenesis protein CcmH [Candidatus Dadabacteria bacterium]MYG82245.1 cytochrome c-type biogenesis protein CcmH [Candidatus Dadabacteria bacterium]MYK49833.1 cytochrome c-type biogenesis protein CcmH [Candidatus Dadabacteria bacterium]
MNSFLRKALSAGLFLSLASFIAFNVNADTLEDQIADISGELMCPVCEGQSVAESNAQLARDMRAVIKTKLLEGNSREEIIDYFVASYGETILASPPPRGFSAILWLLPILSVLIGGAIILRTVYSYRVEEKE